LRGVKEGTGGQVEVLLLAMRPDVGLDVWEALVRPGRRLRTAQRITFGDGLLEAEILASTAAGGRIVRFSSAQTSVADALSRIGSVPLPPYIHAPLADAERYQTVYAREPGSAAAPTAGLHFTPALLESLQASGVGVAFVTLHIGLDTFRPIEVGKLAEHTMHSEELELDEPTAARINATHAAGGRIVAVGTTSVRVLESVAKITHERRAAAFDEQINENDIVMPFRGRTSLFITPGHTFRAVDVMLTNFHLPRSTLLVLVSAFASRELMLHAYEEAVREHYRFYSFGDAMLIL
jgi:S-adenosylmethionine:tRNA ribosyltransferase-isomerase